ncbi:hypothetical protein J2Z60_001517 [Lactobacillus colini]|uniref:S-layer protein C-terminal domain-containing protein n=1 Tax=Lactobacillus colini TaxID=1819254 RepID=A0ABS4MF92_9LACO|nr:SLAP domain-containing protein [Lactobacillus colini]MBP2058338.1 hypothetical protein [Lactobacillus colini]
MNRKKLIIHILITTLTICGIINTNSKAKAADQKDTPTSTVTLNHNSYIYDKNGKRISKNKLLKNQKVKVFGKITKLTKAKKYYLFKPVSNENDTPKLYWLPYTIHKGWAYYQLTNGGYIKVANVDSINDTWHLLASYTTVTVTESSTLDDINGKSTTTYIKKGSKLTVDHYIHIGITPEDEPENMSYHIKDTNLFIPVEFVKAPRTGLIAELIRYNPNLRSVFDDYL